MTGVETIARIRFEDFRTAGDQADRPGAGGRPGHGAQGAAVSGHRFQVQAIAQQAPKLGPWIETLAAILIRPRRLVAPSRLAEGGVGHEEDAPVHADSINLLPRRL